MNEHDPIIAQSTLDTMDRLSTAPPTSDQFTKADQRKPLWEIARDAYCISAGIDSTGPIPSFSYAAWGAAFRAIADEVVPEEPFPIIGKWLAEVIELEKRAQRMAIRQRLLDAAGEAEGMEP